MNNNIKKSENLNFKYGFYKNYKAFKDYHLANNLCDKYFNDRYAEILAFIVDEFYRNDNMPSMIINKERYVMMNSNYILDNLIFLKINSGMLKKYLRPLKINGLIKVHVEMRKDRFINVNKQLIDLYFFKGWTISSINYLEKMKPHLWNSFKNEWQPQFKDKESFKTFIDAFNATRDINGSKYNTTDIFNHLINSVQFKIYGKIINKY